MGLFDWFKRGEPESTSPQPSSPSLTAEQQFTLLALEIAKSAEGIERVLPASDDFALLVWPEGAEEPSRTYLRNIFWETREMGADAKRAALERFLGAVHVGSLPDEAWETARERLVPVIRASNTFLPRPLETPVVQRPFAPCVIETLVLDRENSMQFVVDSDLSKWGVDATTAFDAARDSFACRQHSLEPYASQDAGLWQVSNEDAFDCSRALLPAFLRGAAKLIEDDIAFSVPHRDLMLLCGVGNEPALRRLLEVTRREFDASSRNISA